MEGYAERRKITLTNPNRRSMYMAIGRTKAELESPIEDLETENQELQDQLDAIADIVGGEDQDADDTADDSDLDDELDED